MSAIFTRLDGAEVLLVEDNSVDILLTQRLLKAEHGGYKMHVITDGEEALDFLYQRNKHTEAPQPDLVLLDLKLPKKSGMDVLAEIKQDPNLSHIPVIILSTSSAPEDILRSHRLHVNCFVTKPTDLEAFEKTARLIDEFWLHLVQLPGRSRNNNRPS